MPARVNLSDIKGSEGARARRLYAVPAEGTKAPPRRVNGKSFQERSAPARASMRERKSSTRVQAKTAAQRRTRAIRGMRTVGKRSLRIGRTANRVTGNAGGALAGIVALFIGAGILVAVVRNPAVITTPLEFIGASLKAFSSLFGTAGSKAPPQNVGTAPKG